MNERSQMLSLTLFESIPGWAWMWGIAIAVFFVAKTAVLVASAPRGAPFGRTIVFLFASAEMNPNSTLVDKHSTTSVPPIHEWLFALGKFLFGVLLLKLAMLSVDMTDAYVVGWIGMIGIVFVLHFGLFHLLSCVSRCAGVNVMPIMNAPLRSCSVSEFWGQRWNRAFRDLTFRFVYRPLIRPVGPTASLLLSFLASGLIHELVITFPAGSGYGGPTLYFLVQAGGILFERSALGRSIGLGRGLTGWFFCLLVVGMPCGWLFPPSFVCGVIVPFLEALKELS